MGFSRHNPDREDERDFPEYKTGRYNRLPVLDGTSAWEISSSEDDKGYQGSYTGGWGKPDPYSSKDAPFGHAYIVAGDRKGIHDDPDDNEILIKDARVVEVIY